MPTLSLSSASVACSRNASRSLRRSVGDRLSPREAWDWRECSVNSTAFLRSSVLPARSPPPPSPPAVARFIGGRGGRARRGGGTEDAASAAAEEEEAPSSATEGGTGRESSPEIEISGFINIILLNSSGL